MSDLSNSDNSFDGGDWAVVNAQGELDVSDGESSSSSSIEVVEMEELEEAAVQGEVEKSNLQQSSPPLGADGESMELHQLLRQAEEAENMQRAQSVGSEVVTAPVAEALFPSVQSLLSPQQEPSRTCPPRKQPEGQETESKTVCIQTPDISYADKMSETERILKAEQTTQTDTAAPELSDHRLSLSSLWSFSLNSGGTDEASGSDCGSVESDQGEQNSPFATETSSADTQDHQEKEQQPEKEQRKGDILASAMSPGPEGLQSPTQHSSREQELVQPQQAKSSESQQKGGISASSTSPGPELPQSPPQHPPREQARPEVQEQLARPQEAESSELQQKAGSSLSAMSPDPERAQSPPLPRQAESPVSQSRHQVSLSFGGSQDEAGSPDTSLPRRRNMTTTTIHLTVKPMSADTSNAPKARDAGWLRRFLDYDVLWLLTVMICILIGMLVGHRSCLGMQRAHEEQLQQTVVKHKRCLTEFGRLEKQSEAVLQGERGRHEERVRELQDQRQVLTQQVKEAQQQVKHLLAEREKQQTTERTSSEKSSPPGQSEDGQKAAEVWRHLYFSLKEERDIGVMNASACIQFLRQRINSEAVLQYLEQCWEDSQAWTESMMDTSAWMSTLSSLREKAGQCVSAAVKEVPSTVSEFYQAIFRTVFQSAQVQPHDGDTKEEREREGREGSGDENEEDVTIESEDELEMKSQEYEAYSENKHKKKWTQAFNRFWKKTQKVVSRVGNKLQKTWHKIKNKSEQFLSNKPAVGRMAANVRKFFDEFLGALKEWDNLFKEHLEGQLSFGKKFCKHEEEGKKPEQGFRETEKRVSDKGDENEKKERTTKQVVEEENKKRRAAEHMKESSSETSTNPLKSAQAKARLHIQSQFQQLYSKVGSMNVQDWVQSDASELLKAMEQVSKQYDSLHLDLPTSGRQWLTCQQAFWASVVAHQELSAPSLECSRFMAPWQLAVIEGQGSASSPPGKTQEHSASGKDSPWTSVDHVDTHITNSDLEDGQQCSGDDCHDFTDDKDHD